MTAIPQAWSAQTAGTQADWTTRLDTEARAELSAFAAAVDPTDFTGTRVTAAELPACAAQLGPVRATLLDGRGFALVEALDADLSRAHATAAYWAVGQLLGAPCAQSHAGTLLYDVRDTGASVQAGARFSVTRDDSSFHTDGAFMPDMPDIVGLLCLRAAKTGGRSQLVSGRAVVEALRPEPEVLQALHGPFWFDRRGQHGADEPPVSPYPLVAWDGDELILRYMAYYIEVGHDKAGEPLTAAQAQALARLLAVVQQADLRVEFDLAPGQMLFTNNRWILHNRTAYEDHEAVADKRHMVRLWLRRGVAHAA